MKFVSLPKQKVFLYRITFNFIVMGTEDEAHKDVSFTLVAI